MIVTRWQAPVVPDGQQIKMMFEAEGLVPHVETLEANAQIENHRHPFDEVRVVAAGELVIDISGNKLLLRAGDKIIIPSNTKHSQKAGSKEACVCVCATKTF